MSHEPAVERFRELLAIPTISRMNDEGVDWERFDEFIATLARTYPLTHGALTVDRVGGHGLLLRWKGIGDGAASCLMAHYDVVAATDEGWEHPPFGAVVTGEGEDRVLWGRGSIDDKGAVIAILEAVEMLVAEGYTPAADLYLFFGCNEETTGTAAEAAVEELLRRGIRLRMVVDEGGAIVENAFPGVSVPLALVGVSEKGAALVSLTVEQQGGHASTPPKLTATARLARAILRLNNTPFPASLNEATLGMFRAIAPLATGALGFAARNLAISKPVLLRVLQGMSDETRAMTATTQAVTMLEAGQAANALAERATAIINVRVAIGSSLEEAVEHIRSAVHDDAVTVTIEAAGEPSPVSPTTGAEWELLAGALAESQPEAVMVPYPQTGATDSRHFTGLTPAVYRFTPFELSKAERDALHAKNERIRVATWLRGIDFYRALARRL